MTLNRYPTAAEVHAVIEAARRERAQYLGRAFASGMCALKSLIARRAAGLAARVRGTGASAHHGA